MKLIIDTDPGIDDAVALAAALFNPDMDVQLITTVAGNVGVEKTTLNTLRLLSFWGLDIPVAQGAGQPLLREPQDAAEVHGESGMEGFAYHEVNCPVLGCHAVEAMREVLLGAEEKITLVALGPLTNVALLFAMYPEVKARINQLVIMGGSTLRGNKTPMGEFNIVADPEAAKMVFAAGVPMVICGLNIGPQASLPYEVSCRMRDTNPTGAALFSMLQHYRGGSLQSGLAMYDSTAIGFLAKPEMYQTVDCFADVETASLLTLGCTVLDIEGFTGNKPNACVCVGLNADEFHEWLLASIVQAGD